MTTDRRRVTIDTMGKPRRVALGGYGYHMLNRANGRPAIFRKNGDYAAFEQILKEALGHVAGMSSQKGPDTFSRPERY